MALPAGFRLRADRRLRRLDGGRTLVGGMPLRVLRLSERGSDVARRLLAGAAVTAGADAALARRLVDAGLAHPVPSAAQVPVEVVIPFHGDPAVLDRCLRAVCGRLPVTVVDDASPDIDAVASVASAHAARLVRLARNSGPAAARNAGAALVTAEAVAFVDADAVVAPATLERLAAHLADPAVAAVAPRIRARRRQRRRVLDALATGWSPLDLGPEPSAVAPTLRVPYIPSTVLVVRRTALDAAGGFDPALRYGEDVDLVWRLTAAGSTVRYDPTAVAVHDEPRSWRRWLARRAAYGTSAAPLAARHPRAMAPATLRPAPLAAVALTRAGRPRAAAVVVAATATRVGVRLRRAGAPVAPGVAGAALAPLPTAVAAGRWLTQLWWPVAVVLAARESRARRPIVALTVAPPLLEWVRRRPPVDPLRWVAAVWVDEAAYGVGVWRGCVGARSLRPLLPRFR